MSTDPKPETPNPATTGRDSVVEPDPSTSAVCRARGCGFVNEPGVSQCAKCGCWIAANLAAQRHGVDTLTRRGDTSLPPHFQVMKRDAAEAIVSDLGGADNLTRLEAGHVAIAAQLFAMIWLYESDFQTRGMWTSRGRQRSTVAAYLSVVDRFDRISQRIGLKRRPKNANEESVEEWIAAEKAKVGSE